MYIRSSDEEPLIKPPQQQTFVRRDPLRVSTRRPTRSALAKRQVAGLQLSSKSTVTSKGNVSPKENLEDPLIRTNEALRELYHRQLTSDHLNYLPPLPPQRNHDENSQRLSSDSLRRAKTSHNQSEHIAGGSSSHLHNQRAPSPHQNNTVDGFQQDPWKYSGSSRQISSPPHPASAVLDNECTGQSIRDNGGPIDQTDLDFQRPYDPAQPKEPWNQRLFSALRRPSSPLVSQRKSPQSTSDIAKQGNEGKKGFHSFFKRSPSPSTFYCSSSLTDDKTSSHGSLNGQQSTEVVRDISDGSATRSLTPNSSPVTCWRTRNPSDPLSDGGFKRYGSFPLQKKKANYVYPYIRSTFNEKEPDTEQRKRLSFVSFRRPSTPVPKDPVVDSVSSSESCSVNRNNAIQNKGANCFAILPSSRPLHLVKDKFDPETVSIPIERDPRYDKKNLRRKVEVSNTIAPVVTDDNEEKSSSRSRLPRTQRTHSLPETRPDGDSVPLCNDFEYFQELQNSKESGSQSLNAQLHKTNKLLTGLQQTYDGFRTDEDQILPSSSATPVSEQPSPKTQFTFVPIIPDHSEGFHGRDPVNCSTEEYEALHRDLSRCSSSCSSVSGGPDIYECFDNSICGLEEQPVESKTNADHVSYLLSNEEDYIITLGNMMSIYERMCIETPSHIRQHFDLLFKQIGLLYQFHMLLYSTLKDAGKDLSTIAGAFEDEQFRCYKQYMIMTPTVQKDFHKYSTYLNETFPTLRSDFLKPSVRINFYAMLLEGFKKTASEYEKNKLQSSIDYLFNLKRQANTEMTITSVVCSPVDLRLCGDLLMIGDIFCYGGGPLQKRKYHMILFENLLMIASSKLSFFKYKIHYRVEQLDDVKPVEDNDSEFILKVLTEGQVTSVSFKFKVRLVPQRDQWIKHFHKIISQTKIQYPSDRVKNISSTNKTQMLPLSLYKAYPQLLHLMTSESDPVTQTKQFSPEYLCNHLITQERNYIRQIESLLNPDSIGPPESLCTLLGKLYNLHQKEILPDLEIAQRKGFRDVILYLNDHINLFQIYSDYFVVRCQLHHELESSTEASLYITPVQYFACIMSWLKLASYDAAYKTYTSVILQRLKDIVLDAQVRLLSESIINGRIDFYRSGNLLRSDSMEVKTRRRVVHEGVYQVLLFKKIIILTKKKPPYYEYVWDIWLNQVNLGPPSNSETGFKLEVRQGRGREALTFEFRALTVSIQQIWIQSLQQELMNQAENIRKRTSVYNF
ncbi:uncharacterized protein [Palaemon carinicauda]|uniref:uncharacterized protein n=1 Tax=Palaemon carinicauda TaxID=392227 RepID=UPI0035B5DE5E